MKIYEVTIRATIYKTITVEAENEDDAYVEAHEVFSVMPDDSERYEEETLDVKEVEAA